MTVPLAAATTVTGFLHNSSSINRQNIQSVWIHSPPIPVDSIRLHSSQSLSFDMKKHALLRFGSARSSSLMRFLRPSHVKSGEMDGSLSDDEVILDETSLQQDLEQAIKEENYGLAAKLRDDLQLVQKDSRSRVLAANVEFYSAFKNGDFVAMRSIWGKGDGVCVVHPGAGAISGYEMVMSSWEIICGAQHEFPIMIDLRDIQVHVRGDVGYVTCLESVKTKDGSWGRQVATNVFERVDGQWLIHIHHASHVVDM